MNSKVKAQKGFTLIELLVVISIIGILSSVVLVSLNNAKARARDATRISDMNQIQKALMLYKDDHGRYPSISGDSCCDGWDQSPCGANSFIGALATEGFYSETPTDPVGGSGNGCYGYNYYRYNAGYAGCDASKGAFFVLGVRDMESSGRPHPQSPGWRCPNRNWQGEFDWVVGGFENE